MAQDDRGAPFLNIATHLVLAFGQVIILVPISSASVAAMQTLQAVNSVPRSSGLATSF